MVEETKQTKISRRGALASIAALIGGLSSANKSWGAPSKQSGKIMEHNPFEHFTKTFPPGADLKPCSATEAAKYQGKLPQSLTQFWQSAGRGPFGGGIIFIVDPAAYQGTLSDWLRGQTESRYIIARSAFGDIFYYRDRGMHKVGEKNLRVEDISVIDPHTMKVDVCSWDINSFFETYLCQPDTIEHTLRKTMFDAAVKRLGPLHGDEGYYYEPALALGGTESVDHLGKGNIQVHLSILLKLHTK
jgi:hypothetical protein